MKWDKELESQFGRLPDLGITRFNEKEVVYKSGSGQPINETKFGPMIRLQILSSEVYTETS